MEVYLYMTQFHALLRVQLASIGGRMTGGGQKQKIKTAGKSTLRKIGFAVLWGVAGASFMMMFGMMFVVLAEPFCTAGIGWLYMTLQYLLCILFMLFGTVFLAKSQLFEAKDNMILLSMPIRPSAILSVRMLSLFIMNLIWGCMVEIPAMVCWFMFDGFSVSVLLFNILLFMAAGLFSLALSCLLGWGISRISAHIRNKTLITVLFSLAFIGVYYYFCGAGSSRLMNTLLAQSEMVAETLGAVAPLYWIGDAAANGHVISLLLTLCVLLIPFAAVYWLLAKTFISTVTASHGFKKLQYHAEKTKAVSASAALLRRENSRLLSSAVYLLNAGLGLVFLVVAAVFAVYQKQKLSAFLMLLGWDMTAAVFCGIACMMLCMVIFTAPSVSLEANTLWQLRSMPVSSKDILKAKWKLQIVWSALPLLLISAVGIWFFYTGGDASPFAAASSVYDEMTSLEDLIPSVSLSAADYILDTAALLLLPQSFSVFTSGFGLLLGLKYVNLNWTNEAQVIKQGSAVMFYMFGNMALLVLAVVSVYYGRSFMPVSVWLLVWSVIFTAGSFALKRILYTWGCERFESLSV